MAAKQPIANSVANKKSKLPEWDYRSLQEVPELTGLLMQIVDVSARGIGLLREMQKIVRFLAAVEGKTDDHASIWQLERAQKEAELASKEAAKNFPVLHGLAVVTRWTEHSRPNWLASPAP